jgi:phosphatidylinositol dimannoside acyltransferase
MKRDSLRVRLIGLVYLIGWRLTRLAPERWAERAFEAASRRSWRRNERRREIVAENLRPVVGDDALDETVRRAFSSYGRYWMEAFRVQDLSDVEIEARLSCDGCEQFDRLRGIGAVLAVPHIGNWDAGGRWVGKHWGLTAVAEVLRPRALFERFLAFRRALGMKIIPLVKGGDVTAQCRAEIEAGRMVALVCDRDLSGSGIEVKLFGRRTKLPAGPAALALRTGRPLIAGAVFMEPGGRWRIHVLPPLWEGGEPESADAVARLTQRIAEAFEILIGEAPEQWHAFGRIWID